MASNEVHVSDFQLVKSKKRGKKIRCLQKHDTQVVEREATEAFDKKSVLKRIQDSRIELVCDYNTQIQELLKSIQDFVGQIKGKLSCDCEEISKADQQEDTKHKGGIRHIVCYGIGKISSCVIARFQLAFLLCFTEQILEGIDNSMCFIYDPVLNEKEKELLAELNMKVLEENEEGKRKVSEPTIFYMPHCGGPLYNNLLWANWNPTSLSQLIIIGNSFSNMVERFPRRIMESEASFILDIQPFTTEVPLKVTPRFDDIFNDTSIHFFPFAKLKQVELAFWEKLEPKYNQENVEIITKS